MFSLNYLGQASLGSGDMAAAERYFRRALALFGDNPSAPSALDSLLGLAEVQKQHGQSARALDLLEIIVAHHACEQNTRQRAQQLRKGLLVDTTTAQPDRVSAAPTAPLDAVIAALLAESELAGQET